MKRSAIFVLLALAAFFCRPVIALPEDDLDFNALARVAILPTASRVESVTFSPDQKMLAAGLNNRILIWNDKLKEIKTFTLADNARATPDPAEDDPLRTAPAKERWVLALAFSPDSKSIAAACSDGTIRQWSIESSESVIFSDPDLSKTRSPLLSHEGAVRTLAYSRDGKYIASGSEDKTAKLWDAKSGALLHRLKGNRFKVLSVAFSLDGKTVTTLAAFEVEGDIWSSYARAQQDRSTGQIILWEIESGAMQRDISLNKFSSLSSALSPDGHIAVCLGIDDESAQGEPGLVFWNAITGERVRSAHQGNLFNMDGGSVAFSSYGGIVAVAGAAPRIPVKLNRDNPLYQITLPRVAIWNTLDGSQRWKQTALRGPIRPSAQVRNIAISRTARTFAFACNNATVEIWAVP